MWLIIDIDKGERKLHKFQYDAIYHWIARLIKIKILRYEKDFFYSFTYSGLLQSEIAG
jgi:hypothetical protein